MKLYDKVIYCAFIYLIYRNKWILVESSGSTPASGGTGSGNKTGFGLNIDSQYGTGKYSCYKNNDKRTYTAKDKYAFKLVGNYIGNSSVTVWKASGESDFSSKVEVDIKNGKPKKVTVYLNDNKTKVYIKGADGKWTEDTQASTQKSGTDGSGGGTTPKQESGGTTGTGGGSAQGTTPAGGTDQTSCTGVKGKVTETTNKSGVELSLKDQKATDQFDYEKADKVITFTAKGNKGFKLVKTGKKGDIVVWSTDKEAEYATKVVLDGKGKKEKIVTIYMPNGGVKSYKRDGKDKPWEEVSQGSIEGTDQKNCSDGSQVNSTPDGSAKAAGDQTPTTGSQSPPSSPASSSSPPKSTPISTDSDSKSPSPGTRNQTGTASQSSTSPSSGTAARPGQTSSTPPRSAGQQAGGTQQASSTQSSATAARPGQTSSTPPRSAGQQAGDTAASTQGARTGQSGTTAARSSTQPAGTQASSTPDAKMGTQQPSSGTAGGGSTAAKTAGQSGGQPSSQTSESQPKTSPTTQTQTQHGSSSSSLPKAIAHGQSSESSQPSMKSTTDGSTQGAGSPVTTPPAKGNESQSGGSTQSGRGSGTKTGIELKLESTSATGDYNRNEDTIKKIVTFTPKDNKAFKLVKKDNDEIWKTDKSEEFANKVELHNFDHSGEHEVIITLPDVKTKKFIKTQNTNWREIDLKGKTTVTMNVNSEKESCKYSIQTDGTKRTYEAKDGLFFNEVFEWDGSAKYDIWSTTNQNEYSKKVVREGNKVTVHIGDGTSSSTKTFNKGSDNKWKAGT